MVTVDNGNSGTLEIYFECVNDVRGYATYTHPRLGEVIHHFDFANRKVQCTGFTNGQLHVGIYSPNFDLLSGWTVYVTLTLTTLSYDNSVKITREYCWQVGSAQVTSMGPGELSEVTVRECPDCGRFLELHDTSHQDHCVARRVS